MKKEISTEQKGLNYELADFISLQGNPLIIKIKVQTIKKLAI